MHTETYRQSKTLVLFQTGVQRSYRLDNAQSSMYCSTGIILMSVGVAKVHQEPIAKVLGNIAIVALDDFRTSKLIGTYQIPVLFGIELAGEFGGIDQVAEHDRELSTFSFGGTRGP